jgi:hypothetical protein
MTCGGYPWGSRSSVRTAECSSMRQYPEYLIVPGAPARGSAFGQDGRTRPSPGADVGRGGPSPGADVGRGGPSPGTDMVRGGPSPGADVGGVRPLPAQMWLGYAPSLMPGLHYVRLDRSDVHARAFRICGAPVHVALTAPSHRPPLCPRSPTRAAQVASRTSSSRA